MKVSKGKQQLPAQFQEVLNVVLTREEVDFIVYELELHHAPCEKCGTLREFKEKASKWLNGIS